MRDNLDSATETGRTDQPTAQQPGWDLTEETPQREVPAGLGAHFRTNPWQVRRAGWRLFVQGAQRE